jgi:hypothetical protein
MIILVTFGGMLVVAVGLGVVLARRDRRSGPVDQIPIDADKANKLNFGMGGRSSGEYLPPPDDGAPHIS